jgi:hypothetical protein
MTKLFQGVLIGALLVIIALWLAYFSPSHSVNVSFILLGYVSAGIVVSGCVGFLKKSVLFGFAIFVGFLITIITFALLLSGA